MSNKETEKIKTKMEICERQLADLGFDEKAIKKVRDSIKALINNFLDKKLKDFYE